METIKLIGSAKVGKRMVTERKGKEDEGEGLVTCEIEISNLLVSVSQQEELSGLPMGALRTLCSVTGMPYQAMRISMEKRALLVAGVIEHRKDSGVAIASLKLSKCTAGKLKFKLSTPSGNDEGSALMSCSLMWKAAGDEVDDVRALIKRRCYVELTFKEPPENLQLFNHSASSSKQEEAAGDRAKIDRKRRQAGETQKDVDDVPAGLVHPAGAEKPEEQPGDGAASNVVPIGGKRKGGATLAEIAKEASEIAKKHPRKDPPKGGGDKKPPSRTRH